jgi:putative oxidoreductase
MKSLLTPLATPVYALLRVVSGLLLACHGLQKVFGLLGGPQESVGTQLWIGGVLELTCGLAIAIGVFASFAAFVASGMMAVAYFQYHWKFKFDMSFFPVINHGELAVVYCFLFLYIACRGATFAHPDAVKRRG